MLVLMSLTSVGRDRLGVGCLCFSIWWVFEAMELSLESKKIMFDASIGGKFDINDDGVYFDRF